LNSSIARQPSFGDVEEPEVRERRAGRRPARVVDEDVEPAELLDRAGDDLRGRIGIHEVRRDVHEVAGERVELGRATARGGDHAGALLQQRARDGQADALRCARDHRHVSCETQIHACSFFVVAGPVLNAAAAADVRSSG
jgi:hypothetical protein